MVSPNATIMHFLRPISLLRRILSSSIWVPIASMSYSMYLWHLYFVILAYSNTYVYPDLTAEAPIPVMLPPDLVKECPWSPSGAWTRLICIYAIALVPTVLSSLITYMLVEKPAIDARKVFKNKYDKSITQ